MGAPRAELLALSPFCRSLVLLSFVAACDRGSDVPASAPRVGEADRSTDRGYRPTSPTAPRLSWNETRGQWTTAEHEPLQAFTGRVVVMEGRMALDESAAYRQRFRLVPTFEGCVAHGEHALPPNATVEVELPEGSRVEVTDRPLRVEGTPSIERGVGATRLRLKAVAAEPVQAGAVRIDVKRR